MTSEREKWFSANRKLWDTKTAIHLDSKFYDVEGFRAGKRSLTEIELDALPDVRGRTLLHLQCHFGLDTLDWARDGAVVTGLDLSERAIEGARGLAAEMDLAAEFVCANVLDAASVLAGRRFDIVFTSFGTIGWLPELEPWARNIAELLKPGGTFFIAEFHPFVWMLDDRFDRLHYPYFNRGVIREETTASYTDGAEHDRMPEYSWNHPLTDVVGSLLRAGLRIEAFDEFDFTPWPCFPDLESVGPRRWVLKGHGDGIPYVYSIRATKPVDGD